MNKNSYFKDFYRVPFVKKNGINKSKSKLLITKIDSTARIRKIKDNTSQTY